LRRSEARYRSIIEAAPYGVYRVDQHGRITMANPACAAMLGYQTPDELLGLNTGTDVYLDPTEQEGRVVVKHPANVAANVPLSVDRREKPSAASVGRSQESSSESHPRRRQEPSAPFVPPFSSHLYWRRRRRSLAHGSESRNRSPKPLPPLGRRLLLTARNLGHQGVPRQSGSRPFHSRHRSGAVSRDRRAGRCPWETLRWR
jgi:PAS domain-containing protein